MAWAVNDEHVSFIAVIRGARVPRLFVTVVLASSAGRARPWLLGLAIALAAAARWRPEPAQAGLFLGRRGIPRGARRRGNGSASGPRTGMRSARGLAFAIVLFGWLGAERAACARARRHDGWIRRAARAVSRLLPGARPPHSAPACLFRIAFGRERLQPRRPARHRWRRVNRRRSRRRWSQAGNRRRGARDPAVRQRGAMFFLPAGYDRGGRPVREAFVDPAR